MGQFSVGGNIVAHFKVHRKPDVGVTLSMFGGFYAIYRGRWPDENGALFKFELSDDPYLLMDKHGHTPLPHYIAHSDSPQDEQRYQTIFAKHPGAIAAPTAALHFDQGVLDRLDERGIDRASITLHVGAGTFQPVKSHNIADHRMHFERYAIPVETINAIASCRARGGRIIAVGTTTVRSLESWALTNVIAGDTNIFITPGFEFKVVDGLITNFHLPKSTLMMLVSAFAGYSLVMDTYRYAIDQRYRSFSYGDAMLLKRAEAFE